MVQGLARSRLLLIRQWERNLRKSDRAEIGVFDGGEACTSPDPAYARRVRSPMVGDAPRAIKIRQKESRC